jgi:sulfate permease, SulP family
MAARYALVDLRKDLLAGATVAAISLPQAMAYALIAGVDPRFGLYSAIVVTAIASVFGSSSHLVSGPTNAISLVVFSALAFFDPEARLDAYEAMFLLGIMVGSIQILIAVFRLGDLTRYISESVVLGFMAGAASLVALSQVANLFGLTERGTGHQLLVQRLLLTLAAGGPVNARAIGTGTGTVVLVLLLRRLARRYRLPQVEMLLALIVAAAVAAWCGWTKPGPDGKTLLAIIGRVPSVFPAPHVPDIRFWWIKEMAGSAVAVALLGLLEALAIAKSLARQSRQTLDYNRQCLAEGLANLGGGFFQCLPGSGSLTRSAINFQSGAVSRVSGLFTAATVALVVVFLAPLARYVPKAALAGLLLVAAARLIEWRRLADALRASGYDAGLVLVTAFGAVFVSVEFSILMGVMLSILLFVPRAARLKATEIFVGVDRVIRGRLPADPRCTGVLAFDIEGELFFGAAPELDRHFEEIVAAAASSARVVVLRLRRTRNPDLVCMERLEQFLHDMEKRQVVVLLSGVRAELARIMSNLRFPRWLSADRIFQSDLGVPGSSTVQAMRRAYELLGPEGRAGCAHCRALDPSKGDFYYMV